MVSFCHPFSHQPSLIDIKAAIYKSGGELSPGTQLTGTSILDFYPQNCEKINVHCLSHPVHGILLWQLEHTKTNTNYQNLLKKKINNLKSTISVKEVELILKIF